MLMSTAVSCTSYIICIKVANRELQYASVAVTSVGVVTFKK